MTIEGANLILPQMRKEDIDGINHIMSEYNKEGMRLVELGSFTGASTLTLLPYVKQNNGKMYCVDNWHELDDPTTTCNAIYANHDVLCTFRSNVNNAGYKKYVTAIISNTVEAADIFQDNSIDAIFIDADHRYEGVIKDLFAWWPKLKIGALIMGHDYTKDYHDVDHDFMMENSLVDHIEGVHYGVIRLTYEYFPEAQKAGRIFYTTKTKEGLIKIN